jgi:hypothetical protein
MSDYQYTFTAEECASLRRVLEAVQKSSLAGEHQAGGACELGLLDKKLVKGVLEKLRQPAETVMAS